MDPPVDVNENDDMANGQFSDPFSVMLLDEVTAILADEPNARSQYWLVADASMVQVETEIGVVS
jgi:hypothetical protein